MGEDEIEVRREDQDKINKFSRLHQRELLIEEDLGVKNVGPIATLGNCPPFFLSSFLLNPGLQKEKEELDDITAELELADEDELIP